MTETIVEVLTDPFTGEQIGVTASDLEMEKFFFLDPFARPAEKKGGAWMNGAVR